MFKHAGMLIIRIMKIFRYEYIYEFTFKIQPKFFYDSIITKKRKIRTIQQKGLCSILEILLFQRTELVNLFFMFLYSQTSLMMISISLAFVCLGNLRVSLFSYLVSFLFIIVKPNSELRKFCKFTYDVFFSFLNLPPSEVDLERKKSEDQF